jgi:hypothetical protein
MGGNEKNVADGIGALEKKVVDGIREFEFFQ